MEAKSVIIRLKDEYSQNFLTYLPYIFFPCFISSHPFIIQVVRRLRAAGGLSLLSAGIS